ncbi:hypothetical protein JCM10207_008115 [Rhodosporidiobolus poonsookiae]
MQIIKPCAIVIPPSLVSVIHDCRHHVPPLYFAEFEVIYQAVDNRDELNEVLHALDRWFEAVDSEWEVRQHLLGWYVLQWLRGYYLVFMARGGMLEEGVQLSAAVKEIPPSQAANILAAVPPLVLTKAERAHLSTFDIFLPPLPPDTLPPYLPPRPAHVKLCPALLHAAHYQQEQGLDEVAVWNRCGAAVGDAEEWLCGMQSAFR